ncbi:MAG: glycosyl hydrolase family 18 protein, partial [Chloroflexota bacterium]
LMGYEYRTSGSRVAGSLAPLRDPDGLDLRESVERALARASRDRIILALPWYGRAWSTRSDEPGSRTRKSERYIPPSTATYRTSVPRAASAGRRYDREQASAWTVYRSRSCATCPLSWRQLWYDDVDSMLAKTRFALRKGLRGVGVWALGYEGSRPDLWSALRFGLRPWIDESPPAGRVAFASSSVIGEQDGLPLVGPNATLVLEATDGPDGSGVAYVRVATRGRLAGNGRLKDGTTFPAVDSLSITLPDAGPAEDVFIPGADIDPSPAPSTPPASAVAPEPVTIRVQWRDVAGNWSEPQRLPALADTSQLTDAPSSAS